MKLLLVNTVAQGGSIPAYMQSIAAEAARRGHTVAVAKGRRGDMSGATNIQIGNRFDTVIHGLATRLLDRHGLTGRRATLAFIRDAEAFDPDIIHLHNIHGYYLHYPTLFEWLRICGKPVLWTLHDSWAYTGHCAYHRRHTECDRWQTHCHHCPLLSNYPVSFVDRSALNFEAKRKAFTSVPGLRLLPVSDWLSEQIGKSFLAPLPRTTVRIDIDTGLYRPVAEARPMRVLGVANVWTDLKGIGFFRQLRQQLPPDVEIRLVGDLRGNHIEGVNAIGPLSDKQALVREYSEATVFVNPTRADSLGLTNREALACGTPVISRRIFGTFENIPDDNPAVKGAGTDEDLARLVADFLQTTPAGALRSRSVSTARELYDGFPGLRKLFSIYDSVL